MSTAILAELLKLARSTIGRLVTVLLAVAVPAMAAGFVAAPSPTGRARSQSRCVRWSAESGGTR